VYVTTVQKSDFRDDASIRALAGLLNGPFGPDIGIGVYSSMRHRLIPHPSPLEVPEQVVNWEDARKWADECIIGCNTLISTLDRISRQQAAQNSGSDSGYSSGEGSDPTKRND
jgi:hypothetical protein